MFELVADVEKYPEFVPLCAGMRVRSRSEKDDGITVMVAQMTVAYKLIRQTFTSRAMAHCAASATTGSGSSSKARTGATSAGSPLLPAA